MMKRVKYIIIFVLITIMPCFSVGRAGSTAEFLLIAPDARSVGMGETFVSIVDDVYACYWNPAGLSQLEGLNIGYSHNFWFMDFNFDSFAFSYSLGNSGAIGGYLNTLWMSDLIEGMTETGEPTGELIDARFLSTSLVYSTPPVKIKFIREIYFGISLKLISQKIYEYDTSGFALDLGVLNKDIFIKDLNLGFAVYNLGFNSSFIDEKEKLPFKLNFGLSYKGRISEGTDKIFYVLPAVNFTFSDNYGSTVSTGTEVVYFNKSSDLHLILRAGYIFPFDKYLNTGPKAGLGIIYLNLGFDYAASFFSEINYTHTVSVKYGF